jgi:uncharacterized protein YbjQ (UPF0145 family)
MLVYYISGSKSIPKTNTMVYDSFITTSFDIKGYRITEQLGVVRGIIVRSRSLFGNIGGGIQSLFGGNITIYTELCEKARQDAYREMIMHAESRGANAIIGVRYDANEVMSGITEVLCYGTAVKVEKE